MQTLQLKALLKVGNISFPKCGMNKGSYPERGRREKGNHSCHIHTDLYLTFEERQSLNFIKSTQNSNIFSFFYKTNKFQKGPNED